MLYIFTMKKLSSPLNILLVLPFYGGSLPIGNYCAQALKDLGHKVNVFASPDFYTAIKALNNTQIQADHKKQLESGFMNLVSQAVHAQALATRPDLVLCMAQAPLAKSTLLGLKNEGIRTAMWFVEDYKTLSYWKNVAPLYEAFFVIQKEPFLTRLKKIGQERAFYLPLAALPSFHKKINLLAEEKSEFGAKISFVGAGYPNRRRAFAQIAEADFKIWGSDWEGAKELDHRIQRQGARISSEDMVKIFNATAINLNLHSSMEAHAEVVAGDFVNPRTFELAACQAFQLVDERSLLAELFPKDCLATFTSFQEFKDKIDFFLKNPQESEIYMQKAYEHTITHHSYQARMETLLEHMQAIKPFTKQDLPVQSVKEKDMISQNLEELLKKHNLPKDSSLEQLAAHIRSMDDNLSTLESSVLFLHALKKQYTR